MSTCRIQWQGEFFAQHSLAHVNRCFCEALAASGSVSLNLIELAGMPPASAAAGPSAIRSNLFRSDGPDPRIEVRHQFPPDFSESHSALVLMLPWEFGALPVAWRDGVLRTGAEVWCYSETVRKTYEEAGIPDHKLRVIPLGVDPTIFRAEAPPFVVTDEQGWERDREPVDCTFLFVGGTIHRKGIDILLDAYVRAFSASDSVRLIVKDTGVKTVYRDQNQRERVVALANDTSRARVLYLDADLSESEMAGLYCVADCLVQPYRGEGFCLPALEAMACGTPVLVTAGGATDDFVDQTVGWTIPSTQRYLGVSSVGSLECVQPPWLLEPDPEALARLLRSIAADASGRRRRGQTAAERVRAGWTWRDAIAKVLEQVTALATQATPAPPSRRSARESRTPKISLSMIVKNEGRVLADCLRTARPWVDQIVIVDTGSTDDTVEIAHRFGSEVGYFEWCDDFSAARNVSLDLATGDWVLFLDADDTLSWESGLAIREAVRTAPDDVPAFIIPVQFVEEEGRGAATRVDHVKLFRNLPGLRWQHRIHEQILGSIRAVTGSKMVPPRCNAVVLHSGYDLSPEGQAKKRRRDETILALELKERPDDPFTLFNLGMTCYHLGEHVPAIRWLARSLSVAGRGDSIRRKLFSLLAASHQALGALEDATEVLRQGLSDYDDDAELHFFAGNLATQRGELDAARNHYHRVLRCNPAEYLSGMDMSILGCKTHHNLGTVCIQMGDYAEARKWWLKALSIAPRAIHSARALADAALAVDDVATAQAMLAHLTRNGGDAEECAQLRERLRLVQNGISTSIEGSPGSAPRRGRATLQEARRLLNSARESDAIPLLEGLAAQGEAEAAFYLGVIMLRRNNLEAALHWTELAASLAPEHQQTQQQLAGIRKALGSG